MLRGNLHKKRKRPAVMKIFDYASLPDKELIAYGAQAEKKGITRIGNPLIYRQARLWTYGWNKQHGECKGCHKCHDIGTLKMPADYVNYLRVCQKLEQKSNTMTYEDLVLEANAQEAYKEKLNLMKLKKIKEKLKNEDKK
jgi:hypothetical protein